MYGNIQLKTFTYIAQFIISLTLPPPWEAWGVPNPPGDMYPPPWLKLWPWSLKPVDDSIFLIIIYNKHSSTTFRHPWTAYASVIWIEQQLWQILNLQKDAQTYMTSHKSTIEPEVPHTY